SRFILGGCILLELLGMLLLAIRFCPLLGFGEGLYFALYHSICAFCNSGFDLMGKFAPFSSLTAFSGDALVNFVICGLIVLGGLGFLVWTDIFQKGFHWRKYELHSKLTIVINMILIVGGTLLIFIFEFLPSNTAGLHTGEQLLRAMFQAISPRTAGFNTMDLTQLSEASVLVVILLMLVGGSVGSTAGGIKTTTIGIFFLSILSELKSKKHIECFGRRIDDTILRRAGAIIVVYIMAIILAVLVLTAVDNIGLKEAIFEAASAIGTVGLTLGVTTSLSITGKIAIILLMFMGRVGSLSILLAVSSASNVVPSQMPLGKVVVG
ncbi:MAG: potassium transporter TrkG, partial [Clostridiales bacterium]